MSYTSEALDQFILLKRRAKLNKPLALLVDNLITHLSRAMVFKLPTNGIIFPSAVEKKTPLIAMLDKYNVPIRLPFGEIIIEFSHHSEDMRGGEPWSKCVCIACDMSEPGSFQTFARDVLRNQDNEGVFITSVYWNTDCRSWVPCNCGLLMNSTGIKAVPMTPEIARQYGPEVALTDLQMEMQSVVMLMSALACTNVKTAQVQPSAAVNKKRTIMHKSPIRTHHILVLGSETTNSGAETGTHASPRVHLRRGHVRRLEAKNVWVNACVVGDKSRGVTTKDYSVKART